MNKQEEVPVDEEHPAEAELPADEEIDKAVEKVLTSSRWQWDNNVPRYDKRQQEMADRILSSTPGFQRGARVPGPRRG